MQRKLKSDGSCFSAQYEAFPYQIEAFNAIKDLKYSAIFHEQGLGKTKIAVDLLVHWLVNKGIDTVLIVTKKQLISNWQIELRAHLNINAAILTSSAKDNYYTLTSPARIILTNFETVSSELNRLKLFLKARNVAIIIDESARLKNPSAKVTQSLFELSELFKIKSIMSGTPIANRPYDIWAQIYFLDKGDSLGDDFELFKQDADLANDLASKCDKQYVFEKTVGSIYQKISNFTVRETKATSGVVALPTKTYHDISLIFEPFQKEMYKSVKLKTSIELTQSGLKYTDDSSAIVKRMTRLLQIVSNPAMIDDSYLKYSAKEICLDNLLEAITSKCEKVIVWSNFTYNIDYFYRKYAHYEPVKIHGKLKMKDRDSAVNKFMHGTAKVLFATPQAAKEGLTLTSANHAIFYDRGFSLDDYLQAQDRIHRISQEKECHIYKLMIEDSIDILVDRLLIAKQNAAFLGQGDISDSEYREIADYSYADLVKEVLTSEGDYVD